MKAIGKQYGEAIFALACESGSERRVMNELVQALDALEQNPEYMDFLVSPSIPREERVSSLAGVFARCLSEHVVSLLQLMCEKGRFRAFAACVEEYRRLLHVRESLITARVISAVELTQEQRAALIQKLETMSKSAVQLSCEVDASLLGGMIVELNGKIIDGSLRHRLRDVKEVMKG